MKYGKQVVYCNACGKRLHVELPRVIGREWRVCSIGCLNSMNLRSAASISGHSTEPPEEQSI